MRAIEPSRSQNIILIVLYTPWEPTITKIDSLCSGRLKPPKKI